MLCRNEERPDNDEQFVAILSSVSFIMLKKGDYVKAKAFAEQVEPLFRLLVKLKTCNANNQYFDQDTNMEGALRPTDSHRPVCSI